MTGFTAAYIARLEAWSLAAFLIQGGLAMFCWSLCRRRETSPVLRHRLACAHLALLAALGPLTPVVLHWSIGRSASPSSGPSPLRGLPPLSIDPGAALVMASLPLAVWIAGAAFLLTRLACDLKAATMIPTRPASPQIVSALSRLTTKGFADRLRVREADVLSPQVLGWRRPVLLVPPAERFGLPARQRDALLLHELAHVGRQDFAWNVAQRIVLALLWFQPALWALGRSIARERELRCDALAVDLGACPASLAKGLVSLGLDACAPRLGMAAGAGDLAERIDSLISPPPPIRRSTPGAPIIMVAGLALSVTSALAPAAIDPVAMGLRNASQFGATIRIGARDEAGGFDVAVLQGRVVEAKIASSKIPPDRILQHGGQVVLLDEARRPQLSLEVAPQGTIRWRARSAD